MTPQEWAVVRRYSPDAIAVATDKYGMAACYTSVPVYSAASGAWAPTGNGKRINMGIVPVSAHFEAGGTLQVHPDFQEQADKQLAEFNKTATPTVVQTKEMSETEKILSAAAKAERYGAVQPQPVEKPQKLVQDDLGFWVPEDKITKPQAFESTKVSEGVYTVKPVIEGRTLNKSSTEIEGGYVLEIGDFPNPGVSPCCPPLPCTVHYSTDSKPIFPQSADFKISVLVKAVETLLEALPPSRLSKVEHEIRALLESVK